MRGILDNVMKYKKAMAILFCFATGLYAFFMINQLTNAFDGFWQQSFYHAGDVETTSGRWLWPYIDKAMFGLHVEPVTTLLALGIFVLAYVVILMALDVESTSASVLGGLIFFSSPVLSCAMSYRFMSVVYALACLFACIGALACIKQKNNIVAVFMAAAFISFSMGLYQTYLGVFCLVGIISLMCLTVDRNCTIKEMVTRIARFVLSVPIGGILYYGLLKVHMVVRGVELSDYNGVGDISVRMILISFPSSAVKAVKYLWDFQKGNGFLFSAIDGMKIMFVYHLIVGGLFLGFLIYRVLQLRIDAVVRILIVFLCLLLIPIGCNIANIIALGASMLPQMMIPMVVLSALYPVVLQDKLVDIAEGKLKIARWILTVMCLLVTYGQVGQVLIDHSAMKEGYTASITLARGVLDDFKRQGLLGIDKSFFFIGKPSANETFYTTEAYDKANEYAKVGKFWLTDSNMYASYKALFNRVLGVDITVLSDYYETKANDEYYQTVPCYPNDGYILNWDTVIVKISEP